MTVREFVSVDHPEFSDKAYFAFLNVLDGTFYGVCPFKAMRHSDAPVLDMSISEIRFDFEPISDGSSRFLVYVKPASAA
ncbi:MAG: hypothetical protein ACTTHL_04625 [Oribacterium sp.]